MTTRPVCIDHLTLPVADLDASRRFYSAAPGVLGWEELEVDGLPTWGPPGGEDFSIEKGPPPPAGMHTATTSKPCGMAAERPHVPGHRHV